MLELADVLTDEHIEELIKTAMENAIKEQEARRGKVCFDARITYEIDTEPERTIHEFRDEYRFDPNKFYGDEQEMIAFIKGDLMDIAGSGCGRWHVQNVRYEIRRI